MSGKPYTAQKRILGFWSKVAVTANPAKCWNWMGAKTQKGYGYVRQTGRAIRAHRMAWELTNGAIPDGLAVCHHCDNPLCCNPAHLFVGTHYDNMRDRSAKGRDNSPRGESHYNCKLTDALVVEIRERWAQGGILLRELAEEYGVSISLISLIVTFRCRTFIADNVTATNAES